MLNRPSSNIKRVDPDGRLIVRDDGVDVAWRVVSADRARVDSGADYFFCAPDFLFPADSSARALRVEVDPHAPAKPAPRKRSSRARRAA